MIANSHFEKVPEGYYGPPVPVANPEDKAIEEGKKKMPFILVSIIVIFILFFFAYER